MGFPQKRMAKQKKHAVNWFVERTSMHGVPSLAKSKSTKSKVFWGCVCLIGMGMFVLMFISLIIKYFSYPTAVRIDQVGFFFKFCICNKCFSIHLNSISFAKHNVSRNAQYKDINRMKIENRQQTCISKG